MEYGTAIHCCRRNIKDLIYVGVVAKDNKPVFSKFAMTKERG
jgi:hypothetical protein